MGSTDGVALGFFFVFLVFSSLAFASFSTAAVKKQPPPSKSTRPSSSEIRSSAVIFPLAGNVYPDGIYYATLRIGDPAKPYFLDVDTGSDLTWLQCDAPCVRCSKGPHPLYKPRKNNLVGCEDPLCTTLQEDDLWDPLNGYRSCERSTDQCDYEIEYSDSGSSLGVLVADAFALRFTNGSLLHPHLAFGCGYDQQDGEDDGGQATTDGVLGLGLGKAGILSQLRERGVIRSVVGHCLGRKGGGFLFLGDALVPRSGMMWTPMSSHGGSRSHYTPHPASLFYGKRQLVPRDFQVVFDSGSSYTYFSSHTYELFLDSLMKDLNGKPLKAASEDHSLPLCWKGKKPFRSALDARRYFSSLALVFPSAKKALLEIPPEGYLITTNFGNVCLGILNGTEAGLSDLNVIGDISLQDRLVVYDNEHEQIGWASTNCDRNINHHFSRVLDNASTVYDGLCPPKVAYLMFYDSAGGDYGQAFFEEVGGVSQTSLMGAPTEDHCHLPYF